MFKTSVHTLLLDLDNTLIDRNQAMRRAMSHWLQLHPGYPYSLDRIMEQDGYGYTERNDFCTWLLQGLGNNPTHYPATESLLPFLQQQLVKHLQPDNATNEILAQLKHRFRLILASNGSSTIQRSKLQQCKLISFFEPEDIFISGETNYSKPDPRFFTSLLETLSIEPSQAMMIGDNPTHDVRAPQQCGIAGCWVANGRTWNQPAAPDLVIDHFTAISEWLNH